jgi:putative copper resistance protein D
MSQAIEPVAIAQMVLGAVADIAFAFSVGSALLAPGGAQRRSVLRKALLVWLATQLLALPLQASLMSGTPLTEALSAIPLVVAHSHYGLLWAMGTVAGALALIVALRPIARTTGSAPVVVALAIAGFAHAATTHAADARDFSAAEIVHTAHLIATAGWAGVVITAAWPLRQAFSASPSDVAAHTGNLSNIATLMFLVAIATGIYDAHRGLGGSLWSISANLWGILLVRLC